MSIHTKGKPMKRTEWASAKALALAAALLACVRGASAALALPEEILEKSEAEQARWIEQQVEGSLEEKRQVAQERFDRRMEEKQRVALALAEEGRARRAAIRDVKMAEAERQQALADRTSHSIWIAALLMFPAAGLLVYRRLNKAAKSSR